MIAKRPESVLVVITFSDKILLLQRRDRPDFWQSVTGSMQYDEQDALTSAWRELAEETGLMPADGNLHDCHCQWWFDIYPHWQHRYAANVKRNLEHVFWFEMTHNKAIEISDEHIAFRWVAKEVASEMVFSQSNQQAIIKFVPF